MNPLVRLYPAAWRARYGEEMTELLASRGTGVVGGVDLIRGAIDARRHPELVAAAVDVDGSVHAQLPLGRAHARRTPMVPFLATLGAGLFLVGAASVALREQIPHVAWDFANALATLAAFALGLAMLIERGGSWVTRLGGLALMLGTLTMPWTGVVLPSVFTTVAGAVILAIGWLERRASRAVGFLAMIAAGALAWAYWVTEDIDNGLSLALVLYALLSARVAWSGSEQRWPVVGGMGLAGAIALLVWAMATITSPRILHDGYALTCGALDRATCIQAVDDLATRLRDQYAGVWFTNALVESPRDIRICAHPVDATPLWPCWNAAGELIGGSYPG